MPHTDPTKPMCSKCKERNAQSTMQGLCNKCYRETRDVRVSRDTLEDLGKSMAVAKTAKDWRKLADSLNHIVIGIADGTIDATAAQVAMVKEVMARAHGKVTKSQEDTKGPIGVVILPTLNDGRNTQVCPQCLIEHGRHSDSLGS